MKTLDVLSSPGEMIKPMELIELTGAGSLTLYERRLFNLLVQAALGPRMGIPGEEFTVSTASIKVGDERNSLIEESVERLMATIVVSRTAEKVTRTALLSTNELTTSVNSGVLTYGFPKGLAELVRDSSIFAKLDHAVMNSFSSKYAFSLYESISRRVRMNRFTEKLDMEQMRTLLGVEDGKLVPYMNLNNKAILPALAEVNAITPYQVFVAPRKEGKKFTGFVMSWGWKDKAGLQEAYNEIHRSKVGRQIRIQGKADTIIDNSAIPE